MRVLFSCVAENSRAYAVMAENAALSVREFAGELSDSPVVVNVVDDVDPQFERKLRDLGAEIRVVERVHLGPPPANKLRMFELDGLPDFELLVAIDCDVIVTGDPSPVLSDVIQAKALDVNDLTDAEWARLYRAVNLELSPKEFRSTIGANAIPPQFNTGVITVPRDLCTKLGQEWYSEMVRLDRAAKWRRALPRRQWFFVEQVAFGLAIQRHHLPTEQLPLGANFPTHLEVPPEARADQGDPVILHYHKFISPDGFVTRSMSGEVDPLIERFNRRRADVLGLEYRGLPDQPDLPPPPSPWESLRRRASTIRGR